MANIVRKSVSKAKKGETLLTKEELQKYANMDPLEQQELRRLVVRLLSNPGKISRVSAFVCEELGIVETGPALPTSGGQSGNTWPRSGPDEAPVVWLPTSDTIDVVTTATTPEIPFDEDARVALEHLNLIKARTMFNLVEEFADGKKLLFLTNSQAHLIAQSPDNLQKMLNALEVGEPSLVIDLLTSAGFAAWAKMVPENSHVPRGEGFFGVVPDKPPFVDADEELQVDAAIENFMTDILVPLAAQTKAIVLCDAMAGNCVLSDSFLRAAAVAGPTWAGKLPFTIISMAFDIDELYKGESVRNDDDAPKYWHEVRNASRNWRLRHQKLQQAFLTREVYEQGAADRWRGFDLNPEATCIIMTDCIAEKKGSALDGSDIDYSAYQALHSAMLRHLRTTLPTIAFRSGTSRRQLTVAETLAESLNVALSRAQAGVPLVFLDVRKRSREDLEAAVKGAEGAEARKRLINAAKQQVEAYAAQLRAVGLAESMDTCALGFLHEQLFGPGPVDRGPKVPRAWPLHYAIQRAREGLDCDTLADIPPASKGQVSEAAFWLSELIFKSAWQIYEQEAPQRGGDAKFSDANKGYIHTHATLSRALLLSPNFYSLNLHKSDGAALVNQLVRLDRLPPSSPLDGLLLLQDAWREYDISMWSADRYKRLCKGLFLLQLTLAWLIVGLESLSIIFLMSENACEEEPPFLHESEAVIFSIAVAASAVVAFDSMFTPKARWRHLRSCSGSLESMIWVYRTRAGVFETDNADSRPETTLCACVKEWRNTLMAGASLASTFIQREHPARRFRHFQDRGPVPLPEGSDDHHSPVNPDQYIKLRIQPQVVFYSRRIPVYTRRCAVLKSLFLLLGAAASILAHYGMLPVVVIVTAFSTALTSWSEFTDYSRKVERYSSAVVGLKNLLSWWKALDDVKKAGKESIDCLVRSAEEIISRERTSWMSIAGSEHREEEGVADPGKHLQVAETYIKQGAQLRHGTS